MANPALMPAILTLLATTGALAAPDSSANGRRTLLATQCECGCLIRNRFTGGCVQCKPDVQCRIKPCSCPTGHVTNKWDKQHALEARFCAGNRCSPTGCCGGVRYGRQEGGSEALEFATRTALACAACTAGCGACAGTTAAALIEEELILQLESMVSALTATATDLGNKAGEFGGSLADQIKKAIQKIANDIARSGSVSKDGVASAKQLVDFGRCKLEVEPGMSTYSSKTCAWCCNCVNNMDAVRFYLAWRLDCTASAPPPKPVAGCSVYVDTDIRDPAGTPNSPPFGVPHRGYTSLGCAQLCRSTAGCLGSVYIYDASVQSWCGNCCWLHHVAPPSAPLAPLLGVTTYLC